MTECDPKTCPLNQVVLNKDEVFLVLDLFRISVRGFTRKQTPKIWNGLEDRLFNSLFEIAPRSLADASETQELSR